MIELIISVVVIVGFALCPRAKRPPQTQKSRSIALTNQRTEGQVMRDLLAKLRQQYPNQSEQWRWQKAKQKMRRWGSDRRW